MPKGKSKGPASAGPSRPKPKRTRPNVDEIIGSRAASAGTTADIRLKQKMSTAAELTRAFVADLKKACPELAPRFFEALDANFEVFREIILLGEDMDADDH